MSIRNYMLVALALLSGLTLLGESPVRTDSEASSIRTNGWLVGSWTHRIQITVRPDSIQGTGSLIDFPVLLRLGPAHASVFNRANANGSDLKITTADGTTVLGHEVVSFDPVAKEAEIWFRAGNLSRSDNVFYLYYGNPLQTTFPAAGAAWNSKYLAVYHFAENPGQGVLKDWGPRGNNGNAAAANSNWTSGNVTAGQIGQAWNFNGTSHYIQAFGISTPDTSYVISSWLKIPSRSTDFTFHANPAYWHVSAQVNETTRLVHYNAANPWRDLRWGPNPLPTDDIFHYFTWVFDGEADTVFFYFDGIQQPAIPWSLEAGLKHFYTGIPINPLHNQGVGVLGPMYWNNFDLMTGPGDEFHISERTHSPEWIRTEYRNQRTPMSFFTFGPEEAVPPVAVTLFTAASVREGPTVRLTWEINSGEGDEVSGFQIHREVSGNRNQVGWVSAGNSGYQWVDATPPQSAFDYWLRAMSRTGEMTWLGPIPVETAPLVRERLSLHPNPFHSRTLLRVMLSDQNRVSIRVFDLSGRELRLLFDSVAGPGALELTWDGRDAKGRRVSPGAYVIGFRSGDDIATRKVLLLP